MTISDRTRELIDHLNEMLFNDLKEARDTRSPMYMVQIETYIKALAEQEASQEDKITAAFKFAMEIPKTVQKMGKHLGMDATASVIDKKRTDYFN